MSTSAVLTTDIATTDVLTPKVANELVLATSAAHAQRIFVVEVVIHDGRVIKLAPNEVASLAPRTHVRPLHEERIGDSHSAALLSVNE